MTRVLDVALNSMWAMETEALERLLTIAAREHEITDEALEAYRAKALAGTERAEVRDDVAIIRAHGAMFHRANLMTAISGATSYDILLRDFTAALDNPHLEAIVLDIDSPGGVVGGASELAAAIYGARQKKVKPIVAYIGNRGASAAYWLASAADEVVVADTALVGGIGVQATLRVSDDPQGETTYTFISSQSPMKNAGPDTDEGAKAIQSRVDALAQVFVEAVAAHRGRAAETVLKDFGRGDVFVGKDAVAAGLADRVGTFEALMSELQAGRKKAARGRS